MGIAGICIMMLFIAAGVGLLILQDVKLAKLSSSRRLLSSSNAVSKPLFVGAPSQPNRFALYATGGWRPPCLHPGRHPFLLPRTFGLASPLLLASSLAAILVSLGVYLLVSEFSGTAMGSSPGRRFPDEKSNKRTTDHGIKVQAQLLKRTGTIALLYVGYSFIARIGKALDYLACFRAPLPR